MLKTRNSAKLHKYLGQNPRIVNVDGIKKAGALGHDLGFMLDVSQTLAAKGISGDFSLDAYAYPHGTIAEMVYFHLRGTGVPTQQATLEMLGLPMPCESDASTIEPFLREATSLVLPAGSFVEMYRVLVNGEGFKLKSSPMPVEMMVERLGTEPMSLDRGIRRVGEEFLNYEFAKRNTAKGVNVRANYSQRLLEFDRLPANYGVNVALIPSIFARKMKAIESLKGRFTDVSRHIAKMSRKKGPGIFSIGKNLDEHIDLIWTKEMMRFGRASRLIANYDPHSIRERLPAPSAGYDEFARVVDADIQVEPVSKLHLLKTLTRHPAVVDLHHSHGLGYVNGERMLCAAVQYCNNFRTVLLDQHYETRQDSAKAIVDGLAAHSLPIIRAPPISKYRSGNNNFIFALNDF